MAAFLGSILTLLLFSVLFLLGIGLAFMANLFGGIGNLLRFFTGNRRTTNADRRKHDTQSNSSNFTGDTSCNQSNRPHSDGVFADDEGTYVDFEEIK